MATIKQIIDWANENKMVFHPHDVVEVEHDEVDRICIIKGKPEHGVYKMHKQERFIGHYYMCQNEGNQISGTILFPLNTGKYMKAVFTTSA